MKSRTKSVQEWRFSLGEIKACLGLPPNAELFIRNAEDELEYVSSEEDVLVFESVEFEFEVRQ